MKNEACTGSDRDVSVNLVHNLRVNKANRNVSVWEFDAGIAREIYHSYVCMSQVTAVIRV